MQSLNLLEPIITAAAAANPMNPGDFMQNGILHCGKCRTAKQCRVNIPGNPRVVPCMCRCAKEKAEAEEAERRRQEDADKIMRLRSSGIASQAFRGACFEEDDGKNPEPMRILHKYAEKWDDFSRDNIGLLLYGGVGTGKSYGAACLANYLIERKIPVCMTNLSGILNTVGGFQRDERNEFISDLMKYPLLILDDFGMERQTEFAMEQVFNVIDSRYRSGKPLIVTTNLSLAELKNPKSRDHARIYDRVLEMCQPVNFGNNGRRSDIANEKMQRASQLLRG